MKTPPMPTFKNPSYVYNATVVKIVDGDTIDVFLDLGCNTKVLKRLRFLGVDTWETRGEERVQGLLAKQYVIEKLDTVNGKIVVQTEMDATGKYGRLLAWVWIPTSDGATLLNEELITEGHGTSM